MNGQEGFFFAASLSISLLRHVGKKTGIPEYLARSTGTSQLMKNSCGVRKCLRL